MHVEYYHKNINPLGEASREYIEKKLALVSEIVELRSARVSVEQVNDHQFHMSVDGVTHMGDVRSEEEAPSVNACIDAIEDELKRMLRRDKEKKHDLKIRGGRSIKKKTVIDESARF